MLTERLDLSPLRSQDLPDLYRIYSDPATWQHLPSGRHTDPDQTRKAIEASERGWHDHGAGHWAVRLRHHEEPAGAGPHGSAQSKTHPPLEEGAPDDRATAGLPAGSFIGSGGLSLSVGAVWNLGYRLDPAAWGHGFATELSYACLDLAAQTDPGRAVTARVLENNPASVAVLEKIGLKLIWRGQGTPAGTPQGASTGLLRRIYADRDLDREVLPRLIALG